MIGTAVFGSLEQNVDLAVKIGVGLISVAAAVLAGLQTFLSPIDSAERHRDAATKFSIVQRDIERFFALHPAVDGEWSGFVKELNDRWAQLIAELPTALASHFRRINAEVRRQEPARPPQT